MTRLMLVLLALAAVAASPVSAAQRTVTLSIPGMDCPVCPITVRAALGKVDGVIKTEASLEKREAVVTFDDAKTNVDTLTKGTSSACYPSTVKQ